MTGLSFFMAEQKRAEQPDDEQGDKERQQEGQGDSYKYKGHERENAQHYEADPGDNESEEYGDGKEDDRGQNEFP